MQTDQSSYSTPQQQPPYYQPPVPTPKAKKRLPFFWIFAVLVALLIGYALGSASGGAPASEETGQPTKPAAQQKILAWKDTHTFNGNGGKKTDAFTALDTWIIKWTCDPGQFASAGGDNFIVMVYKSDGTIQDGAINTICKSGNTSGTTTLHKGGPVYLDVNTAGPWTITIQEQK